MLNDKMLSVIKLQILLFKQKSQQNLQANEVLCCKHDFIILRLDCIGSFTISGVTSNLCFNKEESLKIEWKVHWLINEWHEIESFVILQTIGWMTRQA